MGPRALAALAIVLVVADICSAAAPIIAVQSGMWNYGRVDSWTSPTSGITYVKDDPYVTNIGSTDTRCYGSENIKFANGEDALYRCTRASGTKITYKFPNVPNGNYRFFLLLSEDKWNEFRNGNNGREFHLLLEGQFVDSISPFSKQGIVNAALELQYCVTISDGDLDVTLDKTMFTSSQQAALLCGLRLEPDDGTYGACPTPLTRYDTYWLPYRGEWTYAINCAGGPWRSPNGFMWQLDYGYYQPRNGVLVASGVPVPYDGMRDTDTAHWRNSEDIAVFKRRRVGSTDNPLEYSLPLVAGNYLVVVWFLEWSDGAAIQWSYGGRKFDMFFEGQLVKTVDIYATCGAAYRACPMVFRNVAVTDGFLDITFGNVIKLSPTINAIQVKPEDGSGVPAYINYPGKFLADTGKDRPFNWPGTQGNVLYAINCGGGEWIAPDGLLFTVDTWYATEGSYTSVYGSPSAMRNTSYPEVYKSQRRASKSPGAPPIAYTVPVYNAGTYTVRLYFTEYEYNTGTRVVAVYLQGTKVDEFDMLARGDGQHGAVEVDYEVTVAEGVPIEIEVRFVSGREPLINAIEVRIGGLDVPRTLPPEVPPTPLGDYEQFPVPWDGTVPQPSVIAPGPFPPYVGKVMPDGRELLFAINFARPVEDCCCDCSGPPCGCGTYVSSEGITYMESTPFFVPPLQTLECYGGVSGVHVWPGDDVPYANDLALASCHAANFRAFFPNVPPGEYRLRTLHHEEKWSARLEVANDGANGRGGYLDVNGMRINTMDYLAKIGQMSVLYSFDHCITVDSRGHIELASLTLPNQISGPRVMALELWKKDWNGSCPYSVQDRKDLFGDDNGNCFKDTMCIPCGGNKETWGVLPCLRPWAPQGAIEYAINSGGTPYHSPVNNIDYSVDVKFGHGPWHRTGLAIPYDHNNGSIDGTEDDFLFTTRRSGSFGYWLPVSYQGRYLLVLGAMEWDRGYIGGRVWDLFVEDEKIDTVDVYLRCGAAHRACYLPYYVHVWDGMLNIWVSVKSGGAGINNVLVIRDDNSPNSGLPSGLYLPPHQKPYNWKLQGNVLVAINCGGGEVVDPDNGFVWFTDFYRAPNDSSSATNYKIYAVPPNAATIAVGVYNFQRRSDSAVRYEVPLPASGMTVTLEVFCNEYEYAQSGRNQRIVVENGQATDGPFDVYQCAGNSQNECKRTIANIVVADDVLSFSVEKVSGRSALINAFRVIVVSAMPSNASTPPPAVIPVFGRLSCPPGDLGCPCLNGGTCNAPYVCSSYGGCQPVPPPQPTVPAYTEPPTTPPGVFTFAPAPPIPGTVATATASSSSSGSSGRSRGGSSLSKGAIAAIVVVVLLVAIVAVAVVLFVFRERIFGSGGGGRKPTFHEEEMYAQQ